ncbi:UNVERIFIED_CONTAM: hypothetical protein GTU68_037947 [Idotea baltica]|nr:hypothetical protein [Idotea baltica]
MMQIVDWLPTLYSAAGGNLSELPTMDGMDMWESIVNGTPSKRVQMLHNIDPILNQAAVRVGEWKLLFNPSPYGPHWDKWFGPSGRNLNETYSSRSLKKWKSIKKSRVGKAMQKIRPGLYENASKLEKSAEILCGPVPSNATAHCNDPSAPCLFHIPSDPCEYHDVSKDNPARVKVLQHILANFNKTAVPPANQPRDPAANPVYWSYTWTNWQDFKIGPYFRKDQANHVYDIEYVADHLWL